MAGKGDGKGIRMKTRVLAVVFFAAVLSFVLAGRSFACGHDGFFVGGGYQQLFMFTTEHQLAGPLAVSSEKITFGPGYGAHLLIGYDFPGSRWGIQVVPEYSNLNLNHSERVNYFGTAVEGILHIIAWENGLDFNLVGGVGYSQLFEGPRTNNTGAAGINIGVGPAINWFFHRGEKVRSSLYAQVPVRAVIFFGNNLSKNQTTVLAVPIRIGVSLGF